MKGKTIKRENSLKRKRKEKNGKNEILKEENNINYNINI